MSEESTFALPTGQISLNEMHVEAGGSSGSQCGINDADIRGLINKSSGVQMAMSEWHGASAVVPLSYSLLEVVTSATNSRFSKKIGGGSVTGDDLIVVCGGVEGAGSLSQTYMLNSSICSAHASTPMSSMDHTSLYVGSRVATGSLIGDSTLLVAQTVASGGFRGGCGVFRLVNGARLPSPYFKASNTTSKMSGNNAFISLTSATEDIIFISAYTDFGTAQNISLTTSSGSMATWNGVDNPMGSGKFAVITGARNPTVTIRNTTSGSSPKCAIAGVVFGG